jgi:hypothetical protein
MSTGVRGRLPVSLRNTFPCVTVERVVLWIEYSVSDIGQKERLETALQPMLALWLQYLLQSLEIAVYSTVQVTVVRNSYVSYACFVARVPVKVVRNSIVSYACFVATVVRNSCVSYSTTYSC